MESHPRILISELMREAQLTKRPNLIVEGQSDKRFFGTWISGFANDRDVAITCVDNIEIPVGELDALGLNDGNRSRVICMASKADLAGCGQLFRCVADRDAGHGVENFNLETLLWTDFPAIESYALEPRVWDYANQISFNGLLPSSEQLWRPLDRALSELFSIRVQVEHLSAPNVGKGFTTKEKRISDFDARLTIESGVLGRIEWRLYSPVDSDIRERAYGHDIANIIFEAYRQKFKRNLHITGVGAIENALKSAMLYTREHENHDLFRLIREWIELCKSE